MLLNVVTKRKYMFQLNWLLQIGLSTRRMNRTQPQVYPDRMIH